MVNNFRTMLFASIFFLNACGASSGLNQLFVSSENNEALDVLIHKAEAEFDAGNYDDALKFGEKAYAINANNESAVMILGYIHLAKAGIDAFQLAEKLVDQSSSKTSLTSDGFPLVATSDAASALNDLKTIVGFDEAKLAELGTLNNSNLTYFKSYPIILPIDASKARSQSLDNLYHVNKAISIVCPFVDKEARIIAANGYTDDSRHADANCPETTTKRSQKAKAHFLWAFSHLTEAIAFYNVLLYQPSNATAPNIQLRADSLKENSSKIPVTELVSYYSELKTAVDSIFPQNSTDSQLRAVLNDLKATSLAFGRMAGIPSSLTKSINDSITNIETKSKSVQGTADSASKESDVLKSQLTTKMAASLSAQISALATSNPTEFASQKTTICSSYQSIAGSTATLPAACN